MANTYTQIHIQLVFAVQNRQSLIGKDWKDELYRYITGIVQNNQHKELAINGMPDHLHLLIGQQPVQSLSALHSAAGRTPPHAHLPGRVSCLSGIVWR
jgi:REP element-mobilizing transposase RayT